MDATALLRDDHEALSRLFARLAESLDAHDRRIVFLSIKSELEAHSRMEEEVFYPAVMRLRSSPAREAVRSALEDHQGIDGLLAELDQMDPDDAQFGPRVDLLRQSVERHVRAEEGALFAQARIHLTDERLAMLGRQMRQLKHDPAEPAARVPLSAGATGPGRTAAPDR